MAFIKSLVSIIVPVYNVEKYLKECLDSLIVQTYSKIEIICVEDYSTDSSLSLLNEYSNKYQQIKIVRHDRNQGLSQARNTGMKYAQGEYIAFVDSDDYVSHNYIEKLVAGLEKNESDLTISLIKDFIDEQKDVVSANYTDLVPNALAKIKAHEGVENYFHDLPVMAWAKLYRRSFLEKNKLRFIRGLLHEDEPWSLIIWNLTKKISFAPDAVYFYRKRANSITARRNNVDLNYAKKYLTLLKVLHRINIRLYRHNISSKSFFDAYEHQILKMSYWTVKKIYRSSVIEKKKDLVVRYKIFLETTFNFKPSFFSFIFSLINGNDLIKIRYRAHKLIETM